MIFASFCLYCLLITFVSFRVAHYIFKNELTHCIFKDIRFCHDGSNMNLAFLCLLPKEEEIFSFVNI